MFIPTTTMLLLTLLSPFLATVVSAIVVATEIPLPTELEGTWQSKSKTVTTGPDFYDPTTDRFIEPRLPGLSLSFTSAGKFEEARYHITPNPTKPKCPSGILQFQHGDFKAYDNGSLVLTPIANDGRMLYSDPCENKKSAVYSRWNVTIVYKGWAVEMDTYRKKNVLKLYKFDGSPENPLWLGEGTPVMLPTTELKAGATKKEDEEKGETKSKLVKREFKEQSTVEGGKVKRAVDRLVDDYLLDVVEPATVWWAGVVMVFSGAVSLGMLRRK